MLRVLDLFSGDQAPRADSASDRATRGTLGRVSKPCRARCLRWSAMRHFGGALACGRHQEHDVLRTIGTPSARRGSGCKTGLGCRPALVSRSLGRSKSASALGCAGRIWIGSLARSAQNIVPNSASGCNPRVRLSGTASRTGGSDARLVLQLSSAANGTWLCSPSNTTWQSLCRLETRSHKSRNAWGFSS